MTLEADEFIRRFLLHVLPDGFQRIRHYGFLGHRHCQAKLALCRQLLGVASTGIVPQPSQPDYRDLSEKTDRQSPARLRGLPRWAHGGDRRPSCRGPGTALQNSMRYLTYIRSVLPSLASSKSTARSCPRNESDNDFRRGGRIPGPYAGSS